MIVVYISLTGNVRRFVKRLDVDYIELKPNDLLIEVKEDFVIICPTYSDEITRIFRDFLEHKNNMAYLKGVIGSGDRNFAGKYIFCAKDLSKEYRSPLLFSFEKSGTKDDIREFKRRVSNI